VSIDRGLAQATARVMAVLREHLPDVRIETSAADRNPDATTFTMRHGDFTIIEQFSNDQIMSENGRYVLTQQIVMGFRHREAMRRKL
jgi:hypothetical protein